MPVIESKKSWPVDSQEVRVNKGKLIRVKLRSGNIVKMYEADAIAKGYLAPKAKPQAQNKMRVPPQNKSDLEAPEAESTPPADDFSTIQGVGPATARALAAHGITTFEQLRGAGTLGYVSPKTMKAIEEWRSGKHEDRTSIDQGALDG